MDVSCLLDRTAEQMAESPPIPQIPRFEHYDAPTQAELDGLAVDRPMMAVTVCGPDIGKIVGVVAIEGIPFRTSYGSLVSPMLRDVDVTGINDRFENTMALNTGSAVVEMPAGKFRFGHSPEHLETLQDLQGFHDQNEGTLARFRLYPATLGGKRALILKGSVLASVLEPGSTMPRPTTFADLDQLMHAETSPEWFENYDGSFAYIAHSFVGEGNTNMFTDAERAAKSQAVFVADVRRAKPQETIVATEEETPTVETAEVGCSSCDERTAEEAAAKAEAEQAHAAAQEERIAGLEAQLAAVTAETEGLVTYLMNASVPAR